MATVRVSVSVKQIVQSKKSLGSRRAVWCFPLFFWTCAGQEQQAKSQILTLTRVSYWMVIPLHDKIWFLVWTELLTLFNVVPTTERIPVTRSTELFHSQVPSHMLDLFAPSPCISYNNSEGTVLLWIWPGKLNLVLFWYWSSLSSSYVVVKVPSEVIYSPCGEAGQETSSKWRQNLTNLSSPHQLPFKPVTLVVHKYVLTVKWAVTAGITSTASLVDSVLMLQKVVTEATKEFVPSTGFHEQLYRQLLKIPQLLSCWAWILSCPCFYPWYFDCKFNGNKLWDG